MNQPRSGGRILVDALAIHGIDTVFCVPGESYLPILDALYEQRRRIRTITCRQEGGASFMAEAYAKATGRPGVLLVTRAPGACNATIGVHTAAQDSTPLVVLIGQVPRPNLHREAFQEVDYTRFYGPLCKWVAQVDSPQRLPELLAQAFQIATSGRPGPVALSLPEDVLSELADAVDTNSYHPLVPEPVREGLTRLREMLDQASRPLVIVGGGGWNSTASTDLARFADANSLPVATTFRRQDRIDNTHSCYVGALGVGCAPTLIERVRDADLLLVVGARLGDMTTQGYSLVNAPRPTQRLIHIHPDPCEPGRVFHPTLALCAGVAPFTRAAAAMAPLDGERWRAWTRSARAAYLAQLEPTSQPVGELDMAAVLAHLRGRLPPNAILTTDAGNFSGWMQRFYEYRSYPGQLGPTNGAMGYGVPAAIAARLAYPDRPAVGFCGDGGLLMTGQEIATAVHHGIDPVVLVVNNDMYGTIRMHQERRYPGRVHATALSNPEISVWAKSFGAHGELVTRTEEFPDAFERALAAGRVAVLELRIDPEAITTRTTLTAIREAALER